MWNKCKLMFNTSMIWISRGMFNKIKEINNDEYSLETTKVILW